MPGAWTVVDALDEATRDEVVALLDAVEREEDDEALTEDQRERLERGEPLRHALRRAGGRLTGYAVIVPDAVPLAEPALGPYDDRLVAALAGIAPVTLLLRPAPESVTAPLLAAGWRPVRGLLRMRRPLPADPPPPTDLTVRAFRPGKDDEAWIAQNNAAFAGHPTQSHMTVERLARKLAQPWFDAAGFLLLYDGDDLVASCWTKVHHLARGDVGEIYVISVAPGAQRHGLGRLAVLSGLQHMTELGLTTAELFVESDNDRAIALYDMLGFHAVARVVELRLDGAQPAPTARPTP